MAVYPVFAFAAVMNLVGGGVEPLTRAFLLTCLFYPVMYFISLVTAVELRRNRKRLAALVVSGLPLQYIGVVALIAFGTLLVEGPSP